MPQILALLLTLVLAGCGFNPPKPATPEDSPRVPVNASAPAVLSEGNHE